MRVNVCAANNNANVVFGAVAIVLLVVAAHQAEANTHFLRPLRSGDISQPRQARSVEDFQRIVRSDPELAARLFELEDLDDALEAAAEDPSSLEKRDSKSHFLRALRGNERQHFLRPLRSSHFLRALRNFDDVEGPFVGSEDNAHKRSKAHFLRSL